MSGLGSTAMMGLMVCLAAGLVTAAPSSTMRDATPPRLSAQGLAERIGVNTHLPYTDGKYADVEKVLADLRYLGVRRVRDWSPNPTGQGQQSYERVAQQGATFDMLFRDWNVGQGLSWLRSFQDRHPAAIAAVEGPNEVNNEPVQYIGLKGTPAAVHLQAALYRGVKSDSALQNLPVFNLTSYPDLQAAADYANFHAYAHEGEQPYATLANGLAEQTAVEPRSVFVLTETGYPTLDHDPDGVSERAQARLILNTVVDAAQLGASQIYLYELLDAYPDPEGRDKERHFGLFRVDGSPKPAATALHNLLAILRQSGDGSAGVHELPKLTGVPADASRLMLTTFDGVLVVLWREPPVWDGRRHQDLAPEGLPVSARAGGTLDVYDPALSDRPIVSADAGSPASFNLSDHVLLIRSRPAKRASDDSRAPSNVAEKASRDICPPRQVASPGKPDSRLEGCPK